MSIVPVSLEDANNFVSLYHRHHKRVIGHKFSVGLWDAPEHLIGVAIVGRPIARRLDDKWTLEVVRCCTLGHKNACSMLYRACWRVASSMGYTKLITYILDCEKGTSLEGAGFRFVGKTNGKSWNVPSRPRIDKHPLGTKKRYEIERQFKI